MVQTIPRSKSRKVNGYVRAVLALEAVRRKREARYDRYVRPLDRRRDVLAAEVAARRQALSGGQQLNYYATRGLLVLDEIGYLSYDARAADLLFQVVSRRYERRSLVLTPNLPFSAWPTIFPNAGSAIALIDRLVHHAEIISIEGDSYRRRVAEAKRKPSRPASDG